MKTNAIVRICIYSVLILLLLGILVSVIFGVHLYNNREIITEGRSVVMERSDYPRFKAVREATIYDSPSENGREIGKVSPGDTVEVQRNVTVKGTDWGQIAQPEDGWINLKHFEADTQGSSAPNTTKVRDASSLSINWAAGKIVIQSGDVNDIWIEEDRRDSEKPAVIQKKHDGKIEIDFWENDTWFLGFQKTHAKDLTVTIPRGMELREIDLDIASAQVEILDLTVREIDIDAASGTCTIENSTVGTLDVDTASGDVRFSGSLDELDFDAASAEFEGVFVNCPRSLKLDGMSGDMDITLPADCGFTAKVDAMSSRFNADQPIQTVNGAFVYGDGSCRINVSGMSGDVNVHQGDK